MRKILTKLKIIQSNRDKQRLNPYNPLSYFYIVLNVIVFFILEIIKQTIKILVLIIEELLENPFKWT